MLYRSISVAIIVLLSWFAYSSTQSMQQLSRQQSKFQLILAETTERSTADQLRINKQISEIQAFIVSQNKLSAEKKRLEQKLASQKIFTGFHKSYSQVLSAEVLRSQNQLADAAKLLKSTKKGIWKAGDTYPDKQKILRALMPKIDAAVKAWNKGDKKATAKSVYTVLGKIIQEKGK